MSSVDNQHLNTLIKYTKAMKKSDSFGYFKHRNPSSNIGQNLPLRRKKILISSTIMV